MDCQEKNVIGFCVKCNELYNVPEQMQDLIFPICPPCYRKIFTPNGYPEKEPNGVSTNIRKEVNQSGSLPPVQSSSC